MKRLAAKTQIKRGNCKGSVLTGAMLFLVILSFLAASLSQLALSSVNSSERIERSYKALLLAESGVSHAYAILKQNYAAKDDPTLFPETVLGGGSFDVEILQPDSRVVIQSIGKIDNIERTLLVEVTLDAGTEAFGFGVFSNKEGEVLGNSVVNASMHSNEEWEIKGNAQVNGIVTAVEEIEVEGNASVTQAIPFSSPQPFPTFDFNTYYNLAAPEDRYTGNQNWNNVNLTPTNGVIYVNGNVRIGGTSQIIGCLVVTGKITINGNFNQYGFGDLPAFMSRDYQIKLVGNVNIERGMVYANCHHVEILGNTTIQEGVVITFVNLKATGNFTLAAPLTTIPPGLNDAEVGEGGMRKLTYHE